MTTTRRRLAVAPTTLALAVVVLGCGTALAGLYLLAGLAVALVAGGITLAAGGLVVDV